MTDIHFLKWWLRLIIRNSTIGVGPRRASKGGFTVLAARCECMHAWALSSNHNAKQLILIRCKHSQRVARSFVRGLEIHHKPGVSEWPPVRYVSTLQIHLHYTAQCPKSGCRLQENLSIQSIIKNTYHTWQAPFLNGDGSRMTARESENIVHLYLAWSNWEPWFRCCLHLL